MDAEEIIRVGTSKLGQDGPAGEFKEIRGIFQIKPRQIVQLGLPDVAFPEVEQALDQRISVVFVHQADDAVHVEIDRSVGVAGKEQRLEAIGTCGRPDLVGGAPLFSGVTLGFHLSRTA